MTQAHPLAAAAGLAGTGAGDRATSPDPARAAATRDDVVRDAVNDTLVVTDDVAVAVTSVVATGARNAKK